MGDFDQQMEQLTNALERQAERDAERAERKRLAAEAPMTPEEREREAAAARKRAELDLARASVLNRLKSAGEGRYREQLEKALESLDAEIASFTRSAD